MPEKPTLFTQIVHGEHMEIYMPEIAKTGQKLSTMVEKIFAIYMAQIKQPKLFTNCPWLEKILSYMPQIAKNGQKLSIMVEENIEICMPEIAKTGHKFSNMVGEHFKIYMPQIAKTGQKLSTMVRENFSIYMAQIKYPKVVTNYPPSWLEKILKFTCLEYVAKTCHKFMVEENPGGGWGY